ncbi:MAG TPA: N-methyl-L-tryptophan oxidase [Longimicrobiaceae bacterium]|nr:N-methyl-L-tryptophan oxidase [Longimicrobiaceae bacterium]
MAQRYDVIIAGLGAMGSAAAFHLARRGLRVLGLDRHTPPHELGSSHGESRVIREAYFEHPAYVPLVQRAYELWAELEEQTGQELLRITGALMLGAPESEVVAGALRSAQLHDLPHERLTAEEVRRRFPVLHPSPDQVGVYEPRAGVLFPEACVQAHLDAARAQGAALRFEEPLTRWRYVDEGVEVLTPWERYQAEALVLAVGAWLPGLMPWLPLEVERQVLHWLRPTRDVDAFTPERCPVFLWQTASGPVFYGIPDLGGGVKAALHHSGARSPLERVRREVGEEDVTEVRGLLERYVPAAAGEFLRSSVCLYTNTPDGHFLIDRHPKHSAVWLVSPCSGHGFKFSSAIGELLAQRITEGTARLDTPLFGLERLAV